MLCCVSTVHFKSMSFLSKGGWKKGCLSQRAAEDVDAFLEDGLIDTRHLNPAAKITH